MEITLGTDWRAWQETEWRSVSQASVSVEVVHRGAGKSVFALMRLLGWALERPNSTSAYIAPQQKQCRAFIWPLAKKLISQIPTASFNETNLQADLPGGSRILFLGSENADSIRGATIDGGVVLDEVAQISPVAWGQVIYPAVNRPGVSPRVLFIGTPQGHANLFYEMFERAANTPGWHRCYLTADIAGVYSPDELARLKAEMAPEDFAQEMMLDWSAAVRGAYYGSVMAEAEVSGRITRVPYDPALPVHTSIDLGMRHAFVVWLWQVSGAEIRAIGCQAYVGSSIPQIWEDLSRRKYVWGKHYAPHDSKVRELGSGKSREEIARAIGWDWTIVPQVGLQAGIEATRLMIPRVWFDREGCGHGLEALRLYRPEYRDESRTFSLQPQESWANDFADAFRMFAVSDQGKRQSAKVDYSTFDRMALYG